MRTIVPVLAIALASSACGRAPPPAAQAVTPASAAAVDNSAPATTAAQTAKPDAAHTVNGDATPAIGTAAIDDAVVDKAIDDLLGDHARYRAAFDAFKKAVAAADVPAVAAFIDYPFKTTIDGRKAKIANAADFSKQYDSILTPHIARVIAQQEYRGLFVSGKGLMFGRGEVWLNGICEDSSCKSPNVRVIAIQPTDR